MLVVRKKRVHKEEKKAEKGGERGERCEWRLGKCRVTICTDYDQSRPDEREKRVLKIEQRSLKKKATLSTSMWFWQQERSDPTRDELQEKAAMSY